VMSPEDEVASAGEGTIVQGLCALEFNGLVEEHRITLG
jgi:hypothetical protein